MKPSFFLFGLMALSLSGCGKFLDKFSRIPGGFTTVRLQPDKHGNRANIIGFQSPLEMLVDVLNGGVIVYATNTDTGQIFSTSAATETGGISLTLPNGPYSFAGTGWESTGLSTAPTTTSRVRCGFGGSKTLTGTSETVNIDLSNLNECHDTTFFTPTYAKETATDNTILPMKFVFCGENTDLSTRTTTGPSSTCKEALGSSNFYKGTNNTKMERAAYFSTTNTLMFTASPDATSTPPNKPFELFRMDLDTGVQSKVGMTVSGGGSLPVGVSNPKRIPGQEKVAFVLDQGGTTPDEIWIYNLSNESLTKVSHGTVNSTASGAREFRVSEDGSYLVFVGDMLVDGKFELFSVPIPAGDTYANPTKISSASLVIPGIKECSGCGNEERFAFDISPGLSNNYVLYSATQALAGRYDLHIASLDGASLPSAIATGTKISSTELSIALDEVTKFAFSYNGSHVLYHVHTTTPTEQIYQLNIALVAGTSLTISAPISILASDAKYPFFKMGKTTQRAVYVSNPAGATHTIHTLDLTTPANKFPLFDVAISPGSVSQLELIASDTKVVAAISNSSDVLEIRSSNALATANWDGASAPNGTSISYTGGVLTGGKKVRPISPGGGGSGGKSFMVTSDSSKILFISDMAALGVYKLSYAAIGTGTPTYISGAGVVDTATSVTSFTLSDTDIPFFTAAIDVATKPELYKTQLSASPAVTRENAGSGLDSIESLGGGHDDDDGDFPDLVIMEGHPLGQPLVKEAWSYDPVDSSYQRMSILSGDVYGAGRFKIRMLSSPDGVNWQTAQSSACLKLDSPQFDGDQVVSTVRIPHGDGSSTSPFATAVDVYPLATGCSGTPDTHIFPDGLGAIGASCVASDEACVKASGSDLVLFLKD